MSIIKANTFQDRGGNVLLSSNGSGTISAGGAITNTPAFFARNNALQTISNNTTTIIQVNETLWDTHNAFNTSTYKYVVPTGHAGKYFFAAHLFSRVNDGQACMIRFQVNGIDFDDSEIRFHGSGSNQQMYMTTTRTFDLSVGDAVNYIIYQGSGSSQSFSANQCYMAGHRLIGV